MIPAVIFFSSDVTLKVTHERQTAPTTIALGMKCFVVWSFVDPSRMNVRYKHGSPEATEGVPTIPIQRQHTCNTRNHSSLIPLTDPSGLLWCRYHVRYT